MVSQNRQVFWLKHHHPGSLPGFPVASCKGSTFTAAGPRGILTHFPFHHCMLFRHTTAPVSDINFSLLLYFYNLILASFLYIRVKNYKIKYIFRYHSSLQIFHIWLSGPIPFPRFSIAFSAPDIYSFANWIDVSKSKPLARPQAIALDNVHPVP